MFGVIPVFSHPRSGSTYLMGLLSKASNYVGMMEPFHSFENVREMNISRLLKAHCEDETLCQQLVTDWVECARQNPTQQLELVSPLLKGQTLGFKVFPGHLEQPHIESLFAYAPDVVILRRNLLHSHLSDVIASRSGRYANKNTSEEQVTFQPKVFEVWANRMNRFLSDVEDSSKRAGVKCHTVHYEDITQMDVESLRHLFSTFGINVSNPSALAKSGLKKQDIRSSALDKVTNPDLLEEELERMGWSSLLDANASMKKVITNKESELS